MERYRAHRAMIELLGRLAATRPLVLTLDDMHDADPASIELLLALIRRPPAARVLVAAALRPPAPDGLRDGELIRIDLGPLDPDEALQLIGRELPAAQREAVLRESGGNPFYIEQLVRAGAALPGGVAEAIAGELRALDDPQRRLLEGAAVAGDPFEPELAAAAAEIDDALEPLDGLLAAGLVRATDVPRQFTFRHPLVRRAVYEGAPGGWRLGAHARVARTLASRGAPPTILAHHVEFSAQPGDAQAVALLRAAGDMVRPRTPASAARWYEAALRLVAGAELDPAVGGTRRAILGDLARAEAAAGRLERSRRAVLEALVLVDPASEESVRLVTACAAVEHWLGRHEDARRRLHAALDQHGDSQALKLELAFDALYGLDLGDERRARPRRAGRTGPRRERLRRGAPRARAGRGRATRRGAGGRARRDVHPRRARRPHARRAAAVALVPRVGGDVPGPVRGGAGAQPPRPGALARDRPGLARGPAAARAGVRAWRCRAA